MKITHVETYPVEIPIKPERHMISSLGRHTISRYVLVRVQTDEGIEGAGEATVTARWSGETAHSARAHIEHIFAPLVIGCDPTNVVEIDRRMDDACAFNWFAKSAIEMACWDIHGKATGKPIYELLGGACRPLAIRSRYSMGAYEPERAAARAVQLVEQDFTTIKIKVGRDPKADVERVRAVRAAVGPDIALTIDANGGWRIDEAIWAVLAMGEFNLSLIEQPTPDGDYAALARLNRETDVPVMADEMCFDLNDARELVRNRCADVVSVYPGKHGGIRKAVEILEFLKGRGVACSIGSNLELDVATAAMAHLVVASPNMHIETFPGDLLGADYHEIRVAKEPISIEGPITTITDRPGLGIDVDWQLVKSLVPKT